MAKVMKKTRARKSMSATGGAAWTKAKEWVTGTYPCRPEEREMIKAAALKDGKSTAKYVLEKLLEAAKKTLEKVD